MSSFFYILKYIFYLYYYSFLKLLNLDPILERKKAEILTIEDILDNNDAMTDLKSNQSSQLEDL